MEENNNNTPKEWTVAVEGENVFNLPEEQRWAEIISPPPYYIVDDKGTPEAKTPKTKLILTVKMASGMKADYFINRTSARYIASKLNTDLSVEQMAKWVGKTLVWGKVIEQNVFGEIKKVIYVTEVK